MHSYRPMTVELNQPVSRRATILRILRESIMRNQEDLVKALHREGFDATQSSISRDLRELGVAKAGDRYLVPQDEPATANPFAAVANFVLQVRTAGTSLTVIRTRVGAAQSVAVAIDAAQWPEIVGTISGDDTIFIATNEPQEQRALRERLHAIFGV